MYNPQTLENIWIFSTFKRNHETTLVSADQARPPPLPDRKKVQTWQRARKKVRKKARKKKKSI